jgi:hypothetical protein
MSSRPEVRPALGRPVSREGPPIEWARSRDHRRLLKVGRDVTGELGQSSSASPPEPVAAGWASQARGKVGLERAKSPGRVFVRWWRADDRVAGVGPAVPSPPPEPPRRIPGMAPSVSASAGGRRLQNRHGGIPGARRLTPISTPATPGRANGIRRNAAARPTQLFIAPPSAPPPTR